MGAYSRSAVVMVGLLTSVMAQASEVCTVDKANDVIDAIVRNGQERPVLRMQEAGGFPAVLLADQKGNYTLLVLSPDGRACILAIGEGMAVAPEEYRLPTEVTQ